MCNPSACNRCRNSERADNKREKGISSTRLPLTCALQALAAPAAQRVLDAVANSTPAPPLVAKSHRTKHLRHRQHRKYFSLLNCNFAIAFFRQKACGMNFLSHAPRMHFACVGAREAAARGSSRAHGTTLLLSLLTGPTNRSIDRFLQGTALSRRSPHSSLPSLMLSASHGPAHDRIATMRSYSCTYSCTGYSCTQLYSTVIPTAVMRSKSMIRSSTQTGKRKRQGLTRQQATQPSRTCVMVIACRVLMGMLTAHLRRRP